MDEKVPRSKIIETEIRFKRGSSREKIIENLFLDDFEKIVFIPNALPNELVDIEITEDKKNDLIKITNPLENVHHLGNLSGKIGVFTNAGWIY